MEACRPSDAPPMPDVRFQHTCLPGLDLMCADTARSFARHTHDQFGIGVIDRGAQASASDARQVEAGPGDLIFVNPGEVHDGRPKDGRPRAWRMVYLDPSLLQHAREDVRDGADAPPAFLAPVARDASLRALFDAVHRGLVHGQAREPVACEQALLRLATGLELRMTGRLAPPRGGDGLARARERIDDAPNEPLTLQALAAEAGMSRFRLYRAFRQQLGLSPQAYLLQQRLALARRLLRSGLPPAQAALAAGFFDQSHLNRWFARAFGVTPAGYARAR
jgi:AraC-like DNA-binding protein